ncbi:MAG: TRAP transporter substrate-binding protein DctP [Deltaproteobacteria bacterium]|nr:TRAP transporter substrate-binding protein DctP [Deltaproteobacteria bacterium]
MRKIVIAILVMLLMACCLSGNLFAQTGKEKVELISTSGGPGYPEYGEGFFAQPYSSLLQGRALEDPALKGKLIIKHYPNAQLYNQNDAQMALAQGAIHKTYGGPHFYEQWNPAWALLETPGIIESWEHFLRVMDTEPFKELEKDLASKGITILNWAGNCGDVYIFTKKRCETLDDLKGLKIRYFGGEGQARALKALGITGVFLPYSEVVTALQTNQIEGVITDLTGGVPFMQLNRYAPNMLPYVWGVQPISNAVNTKWYNALPATGKLFRPGIREAFDRVYQGIRTDHYSAILERRSLDSFKKAGGYVAPYKEEDHKKFKKIMFDAAKPIIDSVDPKYIKAIQAAK